MKFDAFLDSAFHADFRAAPFVLYDVGAAGGIYPLFPAEHEDLWRAYGFEPSPRSVAALRERYRDSAHVVISDVALAEQDGPATFHHFPNIATNSSLNPNQLVYETGKLESEAIEVTCRRLDTFCRDAAAPDFIKLDTEGTELAVLRGGESAVMRECLGVVSEIKFLPFASATTCFADLDTFLRERGYVLFDIQTARTTRAVGRRRFGGKKGAIDSAYVLYLRDFYGLYAEGLAADPAKARSKLLKAITLTVRFLYLDYAAELIDFGRSEKLLTPPQAQRLLDRFCGCADLSWRIPPFPGKARLALLFDYVSYLLQPEMKLAVPPMFNNLGNRRSALVRQDVPDQIRLLYPVRCLRDPSQMDLQIPVR
jgi:FkbM family methyltransferase